MAADAPVMVVDRRALPGLLAGLAGLLFGAGAVVLSVPALGIAAALAALAAAAAALRLVEQVRTAEQETVGTAALARLLDLPQPAREEARSLMDPESGLPDSRFFDLAVESRVATARRHLWPMAIVLVEVRFRAEHELGRGREEAIRSFAGLLRRTLREADIACRLGPATFGLVLEDTSEDGGVWTAERLQVALADQGRDAAVARLGAGVAAYPTHGLQADDIVSRARAALTRACLAAPDRGLGHVEVAPAESV